MNAIEQIISSKPFKVIFCCKVTVNLPKNYYDK